MSKILIISDTHRNHDLLKIVLERNQDCEYLIHLGDEPDDLEFYPELIENMQVFFVYGLYHERFLEQNAVNCFNIGELEFCISHSEKKLRQIANDKSQMTNSTKPIGDCHYERVRFLCFGHTHHSYFKQIGGDVWLNPGHLKLPKDRDEIAGYAVVEFNDDKDCRQDVCVPSQLDCRQDVCVPSQLDCGQDVCVPSQLDYRQDVCVPSIQVKFYDFNGNIIKSEAVK